MYIRHLLILLSLLPFYCLSAQETGKKCIIQLREYPGNDPAMWDGLYAAHDGKVYTGLITEGVSAHFYVYDPKEDRNSLLYDIADFLGEKGKGIRTSGKIHNKPVEDSHGNIYFVPLNNGSGPRNIDYYSWEGGHWMKYDPKTGSLENMGLVDSGLGCYPLAIDTVRKFLFGIGFTGYFYRFDLEKRVTKNFGRVSNWDICRDIFCDDEGNVYGSFPTGRVFKYDSKLEKVIDLKITMPYDPSYFPTELSNPMIDRTNDWRAVEWDPAGKVAYGVTCGSGSILFSYDPHDGPEGKFTELARMCDSRFIEGDRKDVPYSTLAFAVDSRHQRIYFIPSARQFSLTRYAETLESDNNSHLIMYDIKSAKRVDLGALQTVDGRKVYGCEAASVGPDGTLYICGRADLKMSSAANDKGKKSALHLIIYKPDE